MIAADKLYSGLVVKMMPTELSHVTEPYYAEVAYYDGRVVVMTVPEGNTRVIDVGTDTWKYHAGRMEIIGPKKEHGYLLLNQSFI